MSKVGKQVGHKAPVHTELFVLVMQAFFALPHIPGRQRDKLQDRACQGADQLTVFTLTLRVPGCPSLSQSSHTLPQSSSACQRCPRSPAAALPACHTWRNIKHISMPRSECLTAQEVCLQLHCNMQPAQLPSLHKPLHNTAQIGSLSKLKSQCWIPHSTTSLTWFPASSSPPPDPVMTS